VEYGQPGGVHHQVEGISHRRGRQAGQQDFEVDSVQDQGYQPMGQRQSPPPITVNQTMDGKDTSQDQR